MKKLLVLLFILMLFFIVFISHFTITSNIVRFGLKQESGNISVFFCSSDDCEKILNDFILDTKKSLYCALYKISLDSFVHSVSIQNNKGVDIKIIVDDQTRLEKSSKYNELKEIIGDNIKTDTLRKSKYNNLMHNKFCIKDNRTIWTGSFNPAKNNSYDDFIIIESALISQNYLKEFEEMWDNEFGDPNNEETEFAHIILMNTSFGDVEIKNYFCPEDDCKKRIIDEIDNANESIHFCLFSFTDNNTAEALIKARERGILVSGIFDKIQAGSKYSMFNRLKGESMSIEIFNSSSFLHYKFFIIDNKTVITGSLNPTSSGYFYNDENVIIFKNEEMAKLYLDDFDRLRKITIKN